MDSLKTFLKAITGPKTVPYHVQAWEREVYIKSWSGADRANLTAWYQRNKDTDKVGDFNAKVIIQSLVDGNGKPEFSQNDVAIVNEIDAKILDELAQACLKVNTGIDVEKN